MLRHVEAATVVGVAVVGCGETVGRIVGFVVGDGRGRGRGFDPPLPAASLSCHSSANSSVRGSILTFGERFARSKSALVLLCNSVTTSRARLWPRFARNDATCDAILQPTGAMHKCCRPGCAGRVLGSHSVLNHCKLAQGRERTHSSIRARGRLIPRNLDPPLARRGSCARPTSPAAAR